MVPVGSDLRPWSQADRKTSVSYLNDELAVMAMIEVTAATLAAHPFLHGVSPDHLAVLARAASDATFPAGHRFFADGGHAICFWLVRWAFGAVAASPVETFQFDARTVRAWCACDPALNYEVTRRVAEVLTRRMKSTRSRLIATMALSATADHEGRVRGHVS